MREQLDHVEAGMIREALRRLNGNKKRVAQELGVSRSYLYKRLKTLDQ
jgi:transcriptional regulator with PAS, ATPase and Fis domain